MDAVSFSLFERGVPASERKLYDQICDGGSHCGLAGCGCGCSIGRGATALGCQPRKEAANHHAWRAAAICRAARPLARFTHKAGARASGFRPALRRVSRLDGAGHRARCICSGSRSRRPRMARAHTQRPIRSIYLLGSCGGRTRLRLRNARIQTNVIKERYLVSGRLCSSGPTAPLSLTTASRPKL